MTGRQLARRVAALEAQLAPVPERAEHAWLPWASNAELEQLLALASVEDRELDEVEQLRAIEIVAGATRRMLAGEARP